MAAYNVENDTDYEYDSLPTHKSWHRAVDDAQTYNYHLEWDQGPCRRVYLHATVRNKITSYETELLQAIDNETEPNLTETQIAIVQAKLDAVGCGWVFNGM